MVEMRLLELRQCIRLSELEACALWGSLRRHLHLLGEQAALAPLATGTALTLRPLLTLAARTGRLAQDRWPLPPRGRPVRPRTLQLEFDEVLALLQAHQAGELRPLLAEQQAALLTAVGKVHQQAQNLSAHFRV
ncbi:hypothetical protein [Hymenobacter rigui]|uniref:Uncharacterized protein n=1 Tax=Hymenobacter rigui TaxID=334424 RepID=A0A428KFW8_9BACT|nr:hypothetical protein [Hymenobacter rigui]RSK45195.1 hypothetical protein EI291_18970 [Hymenobacter rigui]